MKPHAILSELPRCDVCSAEDVPVARKARWDVYIPTYKRWGYICTMHFDSEGCSRSNATYLYYKGEVY